MAPMMAIRVSILIDNYWRLVECTLEDTGNTIDDCHEAGTDGAEERGDL